MNIKEILSKIIIFLAYLKYHIYYQYTLFINSIIELEEDQDHIHALYLYELPVNSDWLIQVYQL